MEYKHVPVMLKEVLEYLDPQFGEYYVDCTLGGGGYTRAISERIGVKGKVLAIDADPIAIKNAKLKNKNKNIIYAHDNFQNLSQIVQRHTEDLNSGKSNRISTISTNQIQEDQEVANAFSEFSGVVLDLGLSSAQLEDRTRGFSFQLADSPLDMSFGRGEHSREEVSTSDIVNYWSEKELEKIFKEYGEEKFSYRIAVNIVKERKIKPIVTVGDLLSIIQSSIPNRFIRQSKIHFATRIFQALRIATNNELGQLEDALSSAVKVLRPGGRIVVVAYHSLEDRIVKNFFRQESKDCLCPSDFLICKCGHEAKLIIITKKIVCPTDEEVEQNPRARSAKLRAAEKI